MNQATSDTVWRALGDPTRRRILELLGERPRTTGELCAAFPTTRFAVMKHLALLVEAGLVEVRRQGRERWNHLASAPLRAIQGELIEALAGRRSTAAVTPSCDEVETYQDEPLAASVTAEPPDSGAVRFEVIVPAPPERTFEALVGDLSAWWGRPFVRSDRAWAVVLEPRVGGRLYEDHGDGDGVLYATVTALERDRELRLAGTFGGEQHVHCTVTLHCDPHTGGTLLRFSSTGLPEAGAGGAVVSAAGWHELLGVRLAALLERGERLGLGHEAVTRDHDSRVRERRSR